jgi:F-type H+-transporting ATPase subunit gamma
VDERVEMPGSAEKLEDLARNLLILLEGWRGEDAVEDVRVYHNAYRTGGDYVPVRRSLLPLDREWLARIRGEPWPSRVIPMFRAPWSELFAFLVREYLFLSLFRAGAESMAAEHASRMQAMEKALGRIEEHLDELRGRHRTLRQAAATEELLDVSAGYEALITPWEGPAGDDRAAPGGGDGGR